MSAKHWFTSVLLLSLTASAAWAAHGIVLTRNGQTFEGEITEEENVVTVTNQGIQSRIMRSDVQKIRMTGDPSKEIKTAWDALAAGDVRGRLVLSRRAFQIRDYAMASVLAGQAAKIDPNDRDAADLLNLIRRQVTMEERATGAANAQRSQRTVGGAADPTQAIPVVLMGDRDMNALRQAELRPGDDNSVRVRFNNDVRRRFVSLPQTNAAAFAELTAFQQALAIIREGSAEMRADVILTGDPTAIHSFRSVQRQILGGCAATQCHGSMAGGNFVMFPLPDSDAVTYTNFYLIMKYARINREQPASIFGGAGARVRMINRQHPRQSLVLQYGLPPDLAETPHPRVPGFKALFTSTADPVFGRTAEWIASLGPVDVNYDIRYVSPVEALSQPGEGAVDINPTTAPATRPTTAPSPKTTAATTTTAATRRIAVPATGPVGPVPMPMAPGQEAPVAPRTPIPMPKR